MSARELIAEGLHRSGGLRVLERVARSYEVRRDANSRWPRMSRVASGKFAILCYHRVGAGGIPFYSELPAEAFEAQMKFLRKHYRVVSLEQLLREIRDPESKGQAVAITFDDGYRGLYTEALPILKKYQIPATVYLIAGAVETGEVAWYDRIFLALQTVPQGVFEIELGRAYRFDLATPASRVAAASQINACLREIPDERRREYCAALEKRVALPPDELANRMLSWDQVREMERAGIVFGAHTMSHPALSRLKPQDAERELRESRRLIEERLKRPVADFAFPFGKPADCGEGADALLERCGYRSAVTTSDGINRTGANPYRLRRPGIDLNGPLSLFAFHMNQAFLRGQEEPEAGALPQDSSAVAAEDSAHAMESRVKLDA